MMMRKRLVLLVVTLLIMVNTAWAQIGGIPDDLPPVVPEPSSIALGIVGLAGLAAYAWRKNRKKSSEDAAS